MQQLQPEQTILHFVHDRETFEITTDDLEPTPAVYWVKRAGRVVAAFGVTQCGEGAAVHVPLEIPGVCEAEEEMSAAAFAALYGEGLPGMDRGLAVTERFLVDALRALQAARGRLLSGKRAGDPDGLALLREANTLAATAASDVRSIHGPLYLGKWTEPWAERS